MTLHSSEKPNASKVLQRFPTQKSTVVVELHDFGVVYTDWDGERVTLSNAAAIEAAQFILEHLKP